MSDLIACPACQRNNGIRRTTCLYCGATLPVSESTADRQVPTFKAVEEWEHGFTVVLSPYGAGDPTPHQVERLGDIARMEPDEATAALAAGVPLPVVRVGSVVDAELVVQLLAAAELASTIVADEALALDTPLRRVREIRLGTEALDAHVLWGEWDAVPREELVIAVVGRIVSTKVELLETAGRRRRSEAADASHTFVEAWVVDVYARSLERAFRIKADSFDFSSLGSRPALRLDDNVSALGALLLDYLGPGRYDASFVRVSRLLERAWPAVASVRSMGLAQRGDFKKYTKSEVTTDVLAQFTRYSRMRYVLANLAPSV